MEDGSMTFVPLTWYVVLFPLQPSLPQPRWLPLRRSRRSSPSLPLPHRSLLHRNLLVTVLPMTCPSDVLFTA